MELFTWIKGQHLGIRNFYEISVKSVVTPEQMKERIGNKGNSIAWLVWHLARTEDVTVNSYIRDRPQILLEQSWPDKLGIDATHIGTGLEDDEVAEFSKKIDPLAADEYWKTVAAATAEWLATEPADELDQIPDLEARAAKIPPVLATGDGLGAVGFWSGRRAGFLFSTTVISHGYIHVGEMQVIRGRLGEQAWF